MFCLAALTVYLTCVEVCTDALDFFEQAAVYEYSLCHSYATGVAHCCIGLLPVLHHTKNHNEKAAALSQYSLRHSNATYLELRTDALDFFVFRKGAYDDMPPFRIGRSRCAIYCVCVCVFECVLECA
jgi:hypothetical protein